MSIEGTEEEPRKSAFAQERQGLPIRKRRRRSLSPRQIFLVTKIGIDCNDLWRLSARSLSCLMDLLWTFGISCTFVGRQLTILVDLFHRLGLTGS